ncbi:hypothetical protein GGX14DRAFT_404615 [Mycena pura]|uniref:Uncharacterized protein n=1 Tax=Mycena pura TaxID=153505 RepID=A0AAD6UY45_9AGAR|nr:hypothetical protein GGX14DRAFT_404615 [Mycena pura]
MPPRCEFLSGNDLRSQASGDKLYVQNTTITRLLVLACRASCVGTNNRSGHSQGESAPRIHKRKRKHPDGACRSSHRPGGSTDCGLQWLSAVPDKSMFLLAPAPRAHW